MNQKLLIVLFSTILYIGVSYSFPAEEHLSGAKLSEEKLPKVSSVTEEIRKEKTSVKLPPVITSIDHLISSAQSAASVPQHNETSIDQSKTLVSNSVDKNVTPKSSTEAIKNENQDPMKQNVSEVVDNKTSNQTVENRNASSSDNIPDIKIYTPTSSTKTSSTSTTVASTFTTLEKTTIKSTISVIEPTSTLMAKVVIGQSTPAPAEEKHFDGPSFIGGIVLTIGLTAIGFIAFKYYKSGKIDMNYRTL